MITDGFRQYLLKVSLGGTTQEGEARPVFKETFAELGLPDALRSDNGPPLTLLEAMRPAFADWAEQERRFAEFRKECNEERPP
jgi:hypothetical protein